MTKADKVVLTLIGDPPPSLNQQQKMHWAKRAELKDQWSWMVLAEANFHSYQKFTRARVTIKLYFKVNRRRDRDNCTGGAAKILMDALVRCGVLVDDNDKMVDLRPVEIHVDPAMPRVEIEIEEVEEKGA